MRPTAGSTRGLTRPLERNDIAIPCSYSSDVRDVFRDGPNKKCSENSQHWIKHGQCFARYVQWSSGWWCTRFHPRSVRSTENSSAGSEKRKDTLQPNDFDIVSSARIGWTVSRILDCCKPRHPCMRSLLLHLRKTKITWWEKQLLDRRKRPTK